MSDTGGKNVSKNSVLRDTTATPASIFLTPVGPHAERAVVGDDPHGLQPVGVLAAAAKRPLTTHAVATIDRDGGAGWKTSVTSTAAHDTPDPNASAPHRHPSAHWPVLSRPD